MTALPWPDMASTTPPLTSSEGHGQTRTFLAAARTQLDSDHFGLEKVKRRIVEYLAVVKLKEAAADAAVAGKAEGEETNKTASPPNTITRRGKGVKGPILLYLSRYMCCLHVCSHSNADLLDRLERVRLRSAHPSPEC